MKRDFVAELHKIIQKVDAPKAIIEKLYDIHKRSIPIGVDKVVAIGLVQEDVNPMMERLIKKEERRRMNEPDKLWYYYDPVVVNATNKEKSIFYNDLSITI